MDKLPVELSWMIGENLTSHDLCSFSRASRTHWERLEPLLYRLHALHETSWSTVNEAIELAAVSTKPERQAMSLTTLDKVARFCQLEPAVLDRCHPSDPPRCWLDCSTIDRLGETSFSSRIWVRIGSPPSLSPLHIAALKGLDDIAAWLLRQGANVDAPIPGSTLTALSLAIFGNHTNMALLLLANGADPKLQESDGHLPTVLHLACVLGLAELADELLTRRYVEAQPTELLVTYCFNGSSDAPRLVAELIRRGAEVSEDLISAFLLVSSLRESRWQSACELLTSSDQLTPEGPSSVLQTVLSLRAQELENNVEMVARMLERLLNLGADPDLGRLLWRPSGGVSYLTLLKLLPLFLEAEMDVKPALIKRRRARKPPAKFWVDDLLGHTSIYRWGDEVGIAQLAIICLLLDHGAPIGKYTRGDALDWFLPGPSRQLYGRARWSYQLTQVLLRHCNNTPEDMRGEDIRDFLSHYSKVQGRTRGDIP
ncbi:unnamed protein product [Clonostachys byssicola]|uniref:Uncharacterized protein n=1 Tax=Clonostachys byssicola TaxID=160290 RepID=A0A9N9U428_9HYPO|nr:unnamed protein product [Clonostachys byssicola]